MLDGGRIVAEGRPAELKARVGGTRLDLTLSGPHAYERVAARLGERVVHRDAGRLLLGVATDGDGARVRDVLDEIDPAREDIASFDLSEASLDDVFLALTGHDTKEPAHV